MTVPVPIGHMSMSTQDLRSAGNEVSRAGAGIRDVGAKANQDAARLTSGQLGLVFGDVLEPCVNALLDILSKGIQSAGALIEQDGHALSKLADTIDHAETTISDSLTLFK